VCLPVADAARSRGWVRAAAQQEPLTETQRASTLFQHALQNMAVVRNSYPEDLKRPELDAVRSPDFWAVHGGRRCRDFATVALT
jgi:hypothetical protein